MAEQSRLLTHPVRGRTIKGKAARIPHGVEVLIRPARTKAEAKAHGDGDGETLIEWRGKAYFVANKDIRSQGPADLYRRINFGGR